MRLHLHGTGSCAAGIDAPFADGEGRLQQVPIKDYTKPAQRRRFGRVAKLAYIAASRALEDAGVEAPAELGLVTATGMGEVAASLDLLAQIHASGGRTLSPALVPNTVHNSPAGYLTIGTANHSAAVTVSQGWLSGEAALAAAEDMIAGGTAERVLLVAGDEADPAWSARLGELGASRLAGELASEELAEGAVALVLGASPGGRELGTVRGVVERWPAGQGRLSLCLERHGMMPGGGTHVALRQGAGGAVGGSLDTEVSAMLGPGRRLAGAGPGTAPIGAASMLVQALREEPPPTGLLLIGAEVDELGLVHWER